MTGGADDRKPKLTVPDLAAKKAPVNVCRWWPSPTSWRPPGLTRMLQRRLEAEGRTLA